MLHLTVSNKPHPGLDLLLLSAKHVETRVLGMGTRTAIGHFGKGFGLKLDLLKSELLLLPPMTKVLFTDAYDVLLNGPTTGLEKWLDDHPGKVLFAAEKGKWPYADIVYPKVTFPFPYLNSGVFAGHAKDILSLLKVPFDTKTDDQGYYTLQYVNGNTIVLDHKAEFFQCLYGVDDFTDLPLVTHLNNGKTRVKHIRRVVRKLLPGHLRLANLVIWKEISNLLFTGVLGGCIAFVVLLMVLYAIKSYMWN